MFVRTKTTPNSPRKAVQVVHNVRDGDKVRQKIVRHFGTAETAEELLTLRQLAELYIERERERKEPTILPPEQRLTDVQQARERALPPGDDVRLNRLRGETVTTIGFHDVYGQLYDELGFDRVLPVRQRVSARHLKHVVLARIAQPQSKLATAQTLQERFGVDIPLASIYAMMDRLTPFRINAIKRLATAAATTLLPDPVDVLFFDCTTLYFESFEADALRQHGFSKDAKFKETQVVLALVVSTDGLPLTYELVPGATYEGTTLMPTLKRLQQRFTVRQATVVADRGMLSKDNLDALQQAGFHYVVGARLKQLSKADQQTLKAWRPEQAAVREFAFDDRRLVVSYAPKRAAHDAQQRMKMVAKLRKRFEKQATKRQAQDPSKAGVKAKDLVIGNRGYQRFLNIDGDYQITLDDDKLREAEAWDGLHGVYTSLPLNEASAATALALYRGLWQVEAAFRVTKHDLQVRPIFHWKPERIEAHIAIAFMCLTLVRCLSYRVKVQQRTAMSEERIRTALRKTEVAMIRANPSNARYAIPMPLTADAKKLYKAMNLPYRAEPFVVT